MLGGNTTQKDYNNPKGTVYITREEDDKLKHVDSEESEEEQDSSSDDRLKIA